MLLLMQQEKSLTLKWVSWSLNRPILGKKQKQTRKLQKQNNDSGWLEGLEA